MKSKLVLVFLILFSSTLTIYAQLNFASSTRSLIGTSSAITGTNGKIVTVTSGSDYSWIISDLMTASTYLPQEYFVTLLCATNQVDFGFQSAGSPGNFDTSRKLLGDTSTMETDKASVYYPNQPTGGTTTPVYITSPGATIRWTATRYNGNTYIELRIRDMNNNHLVSTPINSGGTTTVPSNTQYQTSYSYAFGFEVINCGQAKFCVQTAAEAAINPGNCDDGATTINSCAANTCTACDPNVACATCSVSKTTCATCPSPLVLFNGQCLFTCPTGFLSYNSMCYSNCPAGSYQSSATTCTICDASCAQCSGTATSCTACSTTEPFLYIGRCYAACPSGTFNTSRSACAPCAGFCSQCSGNPTHCTTCPAGSAFLYNNFCLSDCPRGSFQSSDTTCSSCTSPCGTCAGTSTSCTSCTPGTPLLYNRWCYVSCPSGSYQSSSSSCQTCQSECLTCIGAGICTSCKGEYELDGFQCIKYENRTGMAAGVTVAGTVAVIAAAFLIRFLAKKRKPSSGSKRLVSEEITIENPSQHKTKSSKR